MISNLEYAPYFEQYIIPLSKSGKSIFQTLEESQHNFDATLRNIDNDKHSYSYAEGKWTIKEIIQHIIDTERIFCYRALCFARNDKTSLPGFDQDFFVLNDNANERDFNDLLNEMKTLRESTIQLYKSFSKDVLLRIGNASGNDMSVRAIGYLFAGHQNHHLKIINERYL